MKFTSKPKLGLEDINVPELFIINQMISLEGTDVKVYLYIKYCLKNELELDKSLLSKKLCITEEELSGSLDRLQTEELINKTTYGYSITDLKEKEIDKMYTPKMVPKKSKIEVEIDQTRTLAASAISDSFFNGLMSYDWYADIGILFDKYGFGEEVMIALFHYCNERNAMNKKYVYAVAESWFKGNVKTFEELEEYLDKITKRQIIMQKISKALRLNRNLSKYEEAYIDKWLTEYGYQFDMIEQALKRTIAIANPSLSYVNGILTNWHKKGYAKIDDIQQESKTTAAGKNSNLKFKNYEQRDYTDLESFYDKI